MIIAILAIAVAPYVGVMIGGWAAGRGRESAYLEGAEDGIGFERRRALRQELREADDA